MERTPHGQPEQSILPLHDQRVRLSCSWKDDPDQVEMIEEYLLEENTIKNEPNRKTKLLTRKFRSNSNLKGPSPWVIEIGQLPTLPSVDRGGGAGGKFMVQASASNPQFIPKDSALFFEFIVTNIPYPKDIYSITVDDDKQELILRTSNKKFFKRWKIAALVRRNIMLEPERINFSHHDTTLTIQYRKPDSVIREEIEWEGNVINLLRKGLGGTGGEGGTGGSGENQPPECKTS